MTDVPAYERHPYLSDIDTEVDRVGEVDGRPFAHLRDTLLYPEGGGQPSDRGLLNGIAVVDVQLADDGIRHLLAAAVSTGPARLELDWDRRFDHMQQHTAQHLLSALALERFGWSTTSFHLGAARCDIEIDAVGVSDDQLAELEELAADAIRAARPVTARRVSPEEYVDLEIRTRGLPESHRGDVRLVEIEGIDVTTCGGTHLRSTAEIEAVKIGETEPMRGGLRLYWIAGGRVRRRLALLEARQRELRILFETSGAELSDIASARLQALHDSDRALRKLRLDLGEARASVLAAAPAPIVDAHFEGADAGFLQAVARGLVAAAPAKAALLTASNDKGNFFVLAAGPDSFLDVAQTGPRVAELLRGRGGGSGGIFQGKAESLDALADAVRLLGTG